VIVKTDVQLGETLRMKRDVPLLSLYTALARSILLFGPCRENNNEFSKALLVD
jgi:hypothetical protein